MGTIMVYGTIVLDRLRHIDSFPKSGEFAAYDREMTTLGGEAANSAAALVAWGADVWLTGNSIGDGPESEFLMRQLEQRGLWPAGVKSLPGPTPVCDIYVDLNGDRTMFGRDWPHKEPTWPLAIPQWVLVDPNHGETARKVALEACQRGSRVYVMDFLREGDPTFEGGVWQSATDWIGDPLDDALNLRIVQKIAAKSGGIAVLTNGPRHLAWATPHSSGVLPSLPSPKQIDSTGAGDMFRAALAFGLSQDWELGTSMLYAASAGALKTQYRGATEWIPDWTSVVEYALQHPQIADEYSKIRS